MAFLESLRRRIPKLTDQTEGYISLDEGERRLLETNASRSKTNFGGKWGILTLTNQRIIWRESRISAWPSKQEVIDISLRQIEGLDEGNLIDHIFRDRNVVRIKLASGSTQRFDVDVDVRRKVLEILEENIPPASRNF
jgi:hypothetical protein